MPTCAYVFCADALGTIAFPNSRMLPNVAVPEIFACDDVWPRCAPRAPTSIEGKCTACVHACVRACLRVCEYAVRMLCVCCAYAVRACVRACLCLRLSLLVASAFGLFADLRVWCDCFCACGSIFDAMVWFSGGNTTSSLHFDTHENYLMQFAGRKTIYLWHPNETANFYMDHQHKFGLSPVNVDRVDLQRFPAVANAKTYVAHLSAGDAIYIPDSWWHLISSYERNFALALDTAPWAGNGAWPKKYQMRSNSKGVYWGEQAKIHAAMGERLAGVQAGRLTSAPIRCERPSPPAHTPGGRPPSLEGVPKIGAPFVRQAHVLPRTCYSASWQVHKCCCAHESRSQRASCTRARACLPHAVHR